VIPDLSNIKEAADRIRQYIHRTPVVTNESINKATGAEVFFKCENLQKAGAFKSRGACNAVFSLNDEELVRGVATHSSGNHAQALSRAASLRKCPAFIVMPSNSSQVKINAVREYGGEITFCKPLLESRESTLREIISRTGATEIHPYNSYRIIEAQATAAYELLEDIRDLDIVVAPVGGGGLLSGTALAVKLQNPDITVLAAEPTGADDAYRSFYGNRLVPSVSPNTIADGLLTSLGSLTWPLIQEYVDDIITVNDDEIIRAMRLIWERMKMIVEPSSAVPLAVILNNPELFKGTKTGVIISGGNIDLDNLPWKKHKHG